MSIYEFDPDDAVRFAREQGTPTRTRGDELQLMACPYCRGGRSGKDKYTFAINLKTGIFNCKRGSCGAKGNMITLHKDFNFSLGRDVDEYFDRTRQKTYRRFIKTPKPVSDDAAVAYLKSRGISEAICRKYHISTKPKEPNILTFPFYDEHGELQFVKFRKTDFNSETDNNKEWCQADCQPILFGMDNIDPDVKTLVMTEGQIDSLSVAEAGIPNAVSVPLGKQGFTWVPYCWDFLCQFDTLIVFGDHENGEITLLDEMKRRFSGLVKHVRPEDYRDCKDANDILRKYGAQAVRDAVERATPVKVSVIKDLTEVKRIDLSKLQCIPTGFGALDKIINGFYMGTLNLLTGARGEGKSTMSSQFGLFAVKAGLNVFYYSGELEEFIFKDWIERQIAGPSHINRIYKPNGYTDHSVDGNVVPLMEAWYKGKIQLYDNNVMEESEDTGILKVVDIAIRQYDCKVIILDNLMTAIEDDFNTNIYRQQTAFVLELAKKAKKYNVIILLVAHPRKVGGNSIDNDDVMGSSNITNLADVVMSYSKPKGNQYTEDTPERLLRVLKNRMNGRTDRNGILLHYDDDSKRVYEDGKDPGWSFGWEQTKFPQITPDEEMPFI